MPSRSVKLTDRDNGFNKLISRVGLTRGKLSVGVFDDAEHGAGVTLLQVAEWVEFGTENAPPRSYIRAWFDLNQPLINEATTRMARQILAGKITREQAFARLGQFFAGKIQLRMASGQIPPPNKPSTIQKKGSSVPTIDTGQLRSSITYRVDK